MFGFSFGEFVMICVVALVFVGPQKLPGLLNTLGKWVRKARTMVYDMRAQSGIDDILKAEGFHGGLSEMRSLLRTQHSAISALASFDSGSEPSPGTATAPSAASPSPYVDSNFAGVDIDATREYPPEGPDAYGALPDDLLDDGLEVSAPPLAPLPVVLAEPSPAEVPMPAAPEPALTATTNPADAVPAAAAAEPEAKTSTEVPAPPLTP